MQEQPVACDDDRAKSTYSTQQAAACECVDRRTEHQSIEQQATENKHEQERAG